MNSTGSGEAYDAYYFAHACGRPYQRDAEWLAFFDGIAARKVEDMATRTVLDAGCAMGFLVEALRRRGVEAYGIDISEYAISQVHPDMAPYCHVASIDEPLGRSYDLIVCIEVLEHLEADVARRAIGNLCEHAREVLFSSTPFDFREATHLNVQPPEYWAGLFARHEFVRDLDLDASFITDWAARFCKQPEPAWRTVQRYERWLWPLWRENRELRAALREMRDRAAQPQALIESPPSSPAQDYGRLEERLATQAARVKELEALLQDIQAGVGWRWLTTVRRWRSSFAPPGPRRDRLLRRWLGRFRR
jgi:SAM-dependent methyltransferase